MASRQTSRVFFLLLGTYCLITLIVNVIHHRSLSVGKNLHDTGFRLNTPGPKKRVVSELKDGKRKEDGGSETGLHLNNPSEKGREQKETAKKTGALELKDEKRKDESKDDHQLGGLSCSKFGGPVDEVAHEMVYWSDIPGDSKFISPFKKAKGGEVRYMTFEKDHGGWNNIRMGMETVVAMAHAMGRTLVLPPEQGMYLLQKSDKNQKREFSFSDFFHLSSLASEHEGLDIISTEEFLKREAMTGKIFDKQTGKVSFPPGNRTKYDGSVGQLDHWLRSIAYVPLWDWRKCMAAFPASAGPNSTSSLSDMLNQVIKEGFRNPDKYVGKPVAVDAPAIDRMRQSVVARNELCLYDEEMQKSHVVHFKYSEETRMLTHFYGFLFFEDWRQDLWTKRFVRDHLRYIDELQCVAARVVHAVRERARKRDPDNNPEGLFDSFHIRRGDFQYPQAKVEAKVIYENSKDELTEGATVYIATDERDKNFFKPMAEHYDICFMDDFKHLFKDLNTNYYGMLDQLIASRGRVFFGTFWSTFTAYINRMRGYHVQKNRLEGFEDGSMKSYYFIPKDQKHIMRKFHPLKRPFWLREFPTSWRDIDKGVEV